MPNKTTKPRTARPIGRPGAKQQPKFKLWVLWKPPAGLLAAVTAGLILAAGGLAAIRYSNAATPNSNGSNSKTPPTAQTQTPAALLWQDGPAAAVGSAGGEGNNNKLDHWAVAPSYIYGGGTVEVVADQSKNKAIRFFGAANQYRKDATGASQRAEQIADLRLEKGKTYWFGYDLWVGNGAGVASEGWQSAWQIAGQPGKSASKLWMSVNTRRDGLGLESNTDSTPAGETPYDTWTRIVVGVKLTDQNAWAEVWRDGQNVVPRKDLPEGSVAGGAKSAVMRAGIYRSPQSWDMELRMANFKIGSDKAAVD